MSGVSLRWGLLLGAIAAALGIGAQAVGFATLPHATGAVDNVVGAVLIAGALGLLALVVALGLAYFAGIRVERAHPRGSLSAEATLLDPGVVNRGPGLAGLLVMALYWIGTTAFGLVGDSAKGSSAGASSFLTTHALLGLVFLAFGFGLGALGGRAPAARSLLDEITKGPPISDAPKPAPGPARFPTVSAETAPAEIAPPPSAAETGDGPA